MMTATVFAPSGFPLTLHERELAPDILRAKATYEDYLDFAEVCPYNLEYFNGEIIAMSQASLPHESLVIRLGTILNNLFDNDDAIQVFGSNIKIEVLATGDSFNADLSVVCGEPDFLRLPSGLLSTSAITNPELVVEVLSKSTMAYDLGDKLDSYKQIPGLRQVLFVSQQKPSVSSYVCSENPAIWLNTSVHSLTDTVAVLGQAVPLSQIYRKYKFA
jgi:Uma2 family endonuclease